MSADPDTLPAGATIPVEQHRSVVRRRLVVNGFEPLFTLVDPEDLNNLTLGAVKSLQGDESSFARLVESTTNVTASFAGEDEQLGPRSPI